MNYTSVFSQINFFQTINCKGLFEMKPMIIKHIDLSMLRMYAIIYATYHSRDLWFQILRHEAKSLCLN